MTMERLPRLSRESTFYPSCCCSISTDLIQKLAYSLPSDPDITLSIGSGSGLLEALLLREKPALNLHVIEVSRNINVFLPEERVQLVNGTRTLCPFAEKATTWLFIYPRDLGLIQQYARSYGTGSVKQIVWIGPLKDVEEAASSSLGQDWSKEATESLTHSEYEASIHWERKGFDSLQP